MAHPAVAADDDNMMHTSTPARVLVCAMMMII